MKKIVFYKCLHFECPFCLAINIFPIYLFDTLYTCDACNEKVLLTGDELTFDGVQVSSENLEIDWDAKKCS